MNSQLEKIESGIQTTLNTAGVNAGVSVEHGEISLLMATRDIASVKKIMNHVGNATLVDEIPDARTDSVGLFYSF